MVAFVRSVDASYGLRARAAVSEAGGALVKLAEGIDESYGLRRQGEGGQDGAACDARAQPGPQSARGARGPLHAACLPARQPGADRRSRRRGGDDRAPRSRRGRQVHRPGCAQQLLRPPRRAHPGDRFLGPLDRSPGRYPEGRDRRHRAARSDDPLGDLGRPRRLRGRCALGACSAWRPSSSRSKWRSTTPTTPPSALSSTSTVTPLQSIPPGFRLAHDSYAKLRKQFPAMHPRHRPRYR